MTTFGWYIAHMAFFACVGFSAWATGSAFVMFALLLTPLLWSGYHSGDNEAKSKT